MHHHINTGATAAVFTVHVYATAILYG